MLVVVFFRWFLLFWISSLSAILFCFVFCLVLFFCVFVVDVFYITGTFNKINGYVNGRVCDKVLFGSSRQQNINSNLLVSLVGRNPLYSVLYPSIDNVPMLKPIKYKTIKNRRKNQKWTIQRHWQHCVKIPRPKTSKEKTHITRLKLTHMFAKGKQFLIFILPPHVTHIVKTCRIPLYARKQTTQMGHENVY